MPTYSSLPIVVAAYLAAPASPSETSGTQTADAQTADAQAPTPQGALADRDDYGEAAAQRDVATLVTDTSLAYLRARGRLVAHPVPAGTAIFLRLESIPAPTKGERKRLMDVLGEMGDPKHLPLFAKELRRAVLAAPNDEAAQAAMAHWTPLLAAQGAAATHVWSSLVADRTLPLPVRARALQAWVVATPRDDLGGLVVLVGRGSATLRSQLTRSVQRRAALDPADRATLLQAIDVATLDAPAQRVPALLQFRAAVSTDDDEAFGRRLAALVRSPSTPFAVRVAALRGLTRQSTDRARDALIQVAETSLTAPQRGTQAGEVLAWLALTGLAPEHAGPLAQRHNLASAAAPRLATLGYALVPLDGDQSWLSGSQDNPWPTVRQAALARVSAPCSKVTIKLLAQRARPKSAAGDKHPAVARSAVQALGRCGAPALPALIGLLNAATVDIEQRTEAARQLTKHGGETGADAVAKTLSRSPPRRLARRLVSALRWVKTPTLRVATALCDAAAQGDNVAYGAVATLESLYDDPAGVCAPL